MKADALRVWTLDWLSQRTLPRRSLLLSLALLLTGSPAYFLADASAERHFPSIFCASVNAQEAQRTEKDLAQGPNFSRALEARIGLTWEAVPIRKVLENLGAGTGIGIWLDRRIDANLPITGTFQNASIPQLLRETFQSEKLAEAPAMEVTQVGSILFVGPKAYVERLRTLASLKRLEAKRELSNKEFEKWDSKDSISWENLAVPREILTELAEKNELSVKGLKNVPHDLWPEKKLPEASLLEISLLILGQFSLTLEFEESGAEIVPLKTESIALTKSYSIRKVSKEKLLHIQEIFPDTKFKSSEKKVLVRGLLEVHDFLSADSKTYPQLAVGSFSAVQLGKAVYGSGGANGSRQNADAGKSSVSGRNPQGVERAAQRFSGTIKGPFWPLLKQLCQMQGFQLEADTDALLDAGIELESPVEFEVKEASVEELFEKCASAGGCEIEWKGETVVVKAAQK